MRMTTSFRPRIADLLESRAVPATIGVVTPTGLPGLSVTLPSQVDVTSAPVQAAFQAFDQSYIRAVDTILLAQGTDGLVVPSRNLAAFDQAVEASLQSLAEQLVLSLNPTTTTATTRGQVTAAIVGDDATSLESQLLARGVSAAALALPNVTSVANPAPLTAVPNVVTTAEQVRPTFRVPVAEGIGTAIPLTLSGPTSAGDATPAGVSAGVRSAFGNFLNDYFKAVQGVLLAPGANGQPNPAARRADFDAQVARSLQGLDARISTTLGRDPATSALGPQVQSAIEGADAASLRARLATLATPTTSQAAVRDFTLGSTRAIAQALALIGGDVAKLLGPAGR